MRRVAALSAMVGGACGVAANASLLGYYALARPWQPGHDGPYEWLGPANDLIGSLSMAALIPVIGYVRRRVPDDRLLGVLSAAGVVASAGLAAGGPLLVGGVITLETQFVVAGVGLPVIFGWLWRASRAARRTGVLPPRTARFGEIVGMTALAATGLAAIGAVLPAGSAAQYVVLGLAAVPGLPAYLAFPVWEILAGRAWWRETRGRDLYGLADVWRAVTQAAGSTCGPARCNRRIATPSPSARPR
ncbi:MAG TPA: hypothetical protein VIU11_08115 [Nakamurella sp.]